MHTTSLSIAGLRHRHQVRDPCQRPWKPQRVDTRGAMDLVSSLGAIRMVWLIKQVASGIAKLPKELTALIVAAVAFVNYSALYYVYFQFYVSFGLRPSDVGLSGHGCFRSRCSVCCSCRTRWQRGIRTAFWPSFLARS